AGLKGRQALTAPPAAEAARETVAGVDLEVLRGGRGQPLLVLHDQEYLNTWHPFLQSLATTFSVVAPSHPGFGRSDLPRDFDTIDDLAYFYLDLLAALGPGPAHLVEPGLGSFSEDELVTLLRNRQSAALFGWKPFMHNPKLKGRLARINRPTLVLWGKSDRIVGPEYGRAYAEHIPGARFQLIPAAGHY